MRGKYGAFSITCYRTVEHDAANNLVIYSDSPCFASFHQQGTVLNSAIQIIAPAL